MSNKCVKVVVAFTVAYIVMFAAFISLALKESENKYYIEKMTEQIYKQEQKISYYEKLLEVGK